jgi:RsiW-degrading membrane proteinase PrsW (M82 family)
MQIVVHRNGKTYGPYPIAVAQMYLDNGSLLPHDLGRWENNPPTQLMPLAKLIPQSSRERARHILRQIGGTSWSLIIGLLVPAQEIFSLRCFRQPRLLYLAVVGLLPVFVLYFLRGELTYWAIALYFSVIWAFFFYWLFETRQVERWVCVLCFMFTAIVSISVLLLVQLIPPWSTLYAMLTSDRPILRAVGLFLGVGINEELCKAAVLFWLVRRPGKLLVPQTVVLYGIMSGLGFGIYEGVHYQLRLNRELSGDAAYLLNIARLTSLPFLHAIWTGIAAYFISFGALFPNRTLVLYFLAIFMPATLHATYDFFGLSPVGLGTGFVSVLALTAYLSNCSQIQKRLAVP